MKKILDILADIQKDCSPIELSIGYVDDVNHVHHDCICIKSAPPIVTAKLIEAGYSLNITPHGVHIDTRF